LSRGVQVAGVVRRAAMRIVAGVGDLVQMIEDGRTGRVLMATRLGDRVTPCAVCTMHEEMKSMGILVVPQNQGQRFISGLASKPLGRFISGLTSNQ
jgi:hypothetical protein